MWDTIDNSAAKTALHNPFLLWLLAYSLAPLFVGLMIEPVLERRRPATKIVASLSTITSALGLVVLVAWCGLTLLYDPEPSPDQVWLWLILGVGSAFSVGRLLVLLTYQLSFDDDGVTEQCLWRKRRVSWSDLDPAAAVVWRETHVSDTLLSALKFAGKHLWLKDLQYDLRMSEPFEAAVRHHLNAPIPAYADFSKNWFR